MAIEFESNVLEAELEVPDGNKQKALAEYGTLISDAAIAEFREKFSGLSADTKEGYEDVRRAIAVCRTTRTGIERKRKELNQDAQAWIKIVNSEAARLTIEVESIEDPLKAMKQAVDMQSLVFNYLQIYQSVVIPSSLLEIAHQELLYLA